MLCEKPGLRFILEAKNYLDEYYKKVLNFLLLVMM